MNKLMVFIAIIFLLAPFYQISSSLPVSTSESWSNYYINYDTYFNFRGMAIDSKDSIILIGDIIGNNLPGVHSANIANNNYNGGIIKLDSHGSLLWSAYFGGNSTENFNKVIIDSNDNIIVLGISYSLDIANQATHNYTFGQPPTYYSTNFLVKYSPTGKVLWTTLYRNSILPYIDDLRLGTNNTIILTQGNSRSIGTTVFNSQGLLLSGNSTYQYFSTLYYDVFSTSNSDIYKLGSNGTGLTYPLTSYILTKYSGNFTEEWSINLSNIIPKIYTYHIQLTNKNDILFFGSFDNSKTSNVNSDYYEPDLSLFYVYIHSNGTIAWKNTLILTGRNYFQSSAYNNNLNQSLTIGLTYSSVFPVINSNSSKYHGNGDLMFSFMDNTGKTLQRSLLGGSGYESALGLAVNSQGNFIVVARSSIPSSYRNSETIIFAVTSDGKVVDAVKFESTPAINQFSNLLISLVAFLIILFVITVFNIYTSNSSGSNYQIGQKRVVGKNKVNSGDTFSFFHCPNDGTRMQAFVSRTSPNAEFLVSRTKIDIGLSNAVAMKKILPYSTENIKSIILKVFEQHKDLEDITLRAMQCPTCHFISATPIHLPEEFVEPVSDQAEQIRPENKKQGQELLYYSNSQSLVSYINPFPPRTVMKTYFKSIATIKREELSELIKKPEVTKLTSLAIIVNSFFPFQFNTGELYSFGIFQNIMMYFLIFLLSSYIYTSLVKSKDLGFSALDNFRLWGIILWINIPIISIFYIIQYIAPNIIIASYSLGTVLDIVRFLLLLILYSVMLSKLTNIFRIANIAITLVIFAVVSYLVLVLFILGFIAMFLVGFLGMFGLFFIILLFSRKQQ